MTVYIAFYKGKKHGSTLQACMARFADSVVRLATRGIYSHCEIAIQISATEYRCFSASARDGGVRMKIMPLPADKWDLIEIPERSASFAVDLYRKTDAARYDWLGVLGFPLHLQSRKRWFCSEWCAAVLGAGNPWLYSPNSLVKLLPKTYRRLK